MSDRLEHITGERRHQSQVTLISLYITILVNVVVIVWGAATLRAEVTELRETVAPLQKDVEMLKIDRAIELDRETRTKDTIK